MHVKETAKLGRSSRFRQRPETVALALGSQCVWAQALTMTGRSGRKSVLRPAAKPADKLGQTGNALDCRLII